jgi:DNA-binding beta-propeller fold protein YncE
LYKRHVRHLPQIVLVLVAVLLVSSCGDKQGDVAPTVVAKIDTGQPVGLAAGFGSVWAADHREETVSRIDPATNEVVKRIHLGVFPSDLAAGEDGVWVPVLEGFRLARIDPETNRETASFPGIHYVAATGAGSVWALFFEGGRRDWGGDWEGHTVVRIDPDSNRVVARIRPGPVLGHGIAADKDGVWVSLEPRGVAHIDAETNRVVARIRLPGHPDQVAVGEGAVWVALLDGRVARIDPKTNRVTATIRTGTHLEYIAAGEGYVWAGNINDGPNSTLSQIDPRTNEVVSSSPICDGPQGVLVAFSDLWVACFEDSQVWRLRP